MDTLEEKLGAVLSNPQLMQQIMSMAASMGDNPHPQQTQQPSQAPGIDPGLLGKLTALAGQTGIDNNQQSLLQALSPYLCSDRIHRLERAMQAAKTARIATDLIGSGALSALIGR